MMDRFVVEGGIPLTGRVTANGSKNATLPLMAAALLAEGTTIIEGVPDLQDVRTMAMVLRMLGADIKLADGVLTIDSTQAKSWEAPYELVRKMRASIYVLGPLVARRGRAKVSLPGGCALGPRPIDLHIKALEKLGCRITLDAGYVIAECERLKGARIAFDVGSVGATGNTLMAAVAAHGKTVIENAACEPEIVDLADMLNAMGAKISGQGTPVIEIEGPTELSPVRYRVIPDRVEAGTFLIGGAATNGDVTVDNCRPDHLAIVLDKLHDAGATIETGKNWARVAAPKRLKAVDVKTAVYPGFPTDLQAPWTTLMAVADGSSSITETIYPERFNHVPELARLGADLKMDLNTVRVKGVERLKGAAVMCSDIRAGAGMVIGTLTAQGRSDLLRIYHLDRGYEKLEQKMAGLGGRIERVSE